MRSISLINHPRLLDIEKWRRVSISSSDSKTLISDFLNQLHCNIFQMRNASLGTQIHCPNADMFSETSKEKLKSLKLDSSMQEQKTSRVYNMHEKCFDMHPHLDNQSII